MSLLSQVVGSLGVGQGASMRVSGAFALAVYTFAVSPWPGARSDSLADDCRKRAALLTAPDGALTCIEVEVVRQIRAAGVAAGWVQGFPCGRGRWGESVWPKLDGRAAEVNALVQERRGRRRTSLAGHPDVLAVDGGRVAYFECKVRDALKPSQVEWVATALDAGLLEPNDVAIARGVLA